MCMKRIYIENHKRSTCTYMRDINSAVEEMMFCGVLPHIYTTHDEEHLFDLNCG